MRTTLTLEHDVAEQIRQEILRTGKALKAVVNDALRVGLRLKSKPAEHEPFRVESHSFGFKSGIDLSRMNQLADELEAEEFAGSFDDGQRHTEILFSLLEGLGTAGNLTTDAHLAALAIEHQAEIYSSDADFQRFPGLRWFNPLD